MTQSSANDAKEIESLAAGNESQGETFVLSMSADAMNNHHPAAVKISPGTCVCERSLTKRCLKEETPIFKSPVIGLETNRPWQISSVSTIDSD